MGDDLLDRLKLLPGSRFAELVYRLGVNPADLRSGSQTEQAIELLRLFQAGQGVGHIEGELERLEHPAMPRSAGAGTHRQPSEPSRLDAPPDRGTDPKARSPRSHERAPEPVAIPGAVAETTSTPSLGPGVTTVRPEPHRRWGPFALAAEGLRGSTRKFVAAFVGALATLAAGVAVHYASGHLRGTQPISGARKADDSPSNPLQSGASLSASSSYQAASTVPPPQPPVAVPAAETKGGPVTEDHVRPVARDAPLAGERPGARLERAEPAIVASPTPALPECAPRCAREGLCASSPSGCVAANDADCQRSLVCKANARCTQQGNVCALVSDADCVASGFCAAQGSCTAVLGRCVARSDDDCARSNACKSEARCTRRDDLCALLSDKDCRASGVCDDEGLCAVNRGRCRAASSDDCRRSRACRELGKCKEVGGLCVKGD